MRHAPSCRHGYCERCIPSRTTGDGIGVLVHRFCRFGLFRACYRWIPGRLYGLELYLLCQHPDRNPGPDRHCHCAKGTCERNRSSFRYPGFHHFSHLLACLHVRAFRSQFVNQFHGMEQSRSTWCHVDCSGHFYSFPLFRVYRQDTADQSAPVCRQGLCVVQPDSVCFWYRHVRQYVFDSALFTGQSGLFGFAGRYVFHASGDYPGSGFSFVRQTDATDQPQGLYRVGNPVDVFEFLYELLSIFSDREVVHHAESLSARTGYGIALHPVADPVTGEYP